MEVIQYKKINLKTIGVLLIGIIVLLFFVSQAIYTHNLPAVTATTPFNGKLSKTEKSTGTANWAEVYDIYVDFGGKVQDVYVKEGQQVIKGQPLFSLSFDEDQIRQNLKELEISRNRKVAEINSLKLQIETNNRHISTLQNEQFSMETVSDFDIQQLQNEIEIAEKELSTLETLFEAGAVAKSAYETALNNIQSMKDKKAELEKLYADSLTKQKESKEDKEKSRNQQIQDYTAANESLKKDIIQAQLDLLSYDIQQEAYEKTLNKFNNNTVISAGETGELIDFSISRGQQLTDGYYAGSIGCGNTYEIKCSLPLDNNFVVVGDLCKLKNTNHSFEAEVTKITLVETGKIATISLQSDTVSPGETFDITFEKESGESYTLVPNGALHMDNDGYFLYQLKRRAGMLGNEYYAQKLRVFIGDHDDQNTAITKGMSFFEPVVLTSDKAFSEGQTLNLSNAGDFFEN